MTLEIDGVEQGSVVRIFTGGGVLAGWYRSTGNAATVTLRSHGLYIVVAGNRTCKVVL